jgi:hypothetical protein
LLPDPNAPKRGLSAYMFFANEQRENVHKENPGISFGELDRNVPYGRPIRNRANASHQARSERFSVRGGRP